MNEQAAIRAGRRLAYRILPLLGMACALGLGIYARFTGLGTWALGIDEFYISRSIDNVLRFGLPEFACGGYYTRGVVFQYIVAGLRALGFPPEFSGRFVSAACGMAVLPAAYLLGRRLSGPLAGWVTVAILSVSVWEVEMARFARMYAPFQAVFSWYVLAFLRYTVDRQAAAMRWMVVLSVLGVLTWEGGALLGAANLLAVILLHDRGRIQRDDWPRLAGLAVLFAVLYAATTDLRGFTEPPATPAAVPDTSANSAFHVAAWMAPLWRHPSWALGLIVPVAFAIPALRWISTFRNRPLQWMGLAGALLAAAGHFFTVTAAILVLMPLARIADLPALRPVRSRYFWSALASFLAFWLIVGMRSADAPAHTAVLLALKEEFAFPDIVDAVLRPWGRTLPVLSAGILVTVAYLIWDALAGGAEAAADRGPGRAACVLVALILLMALAVGATPTDRIETRYTFFLYPGLIALAVAGILRFMWTRSSLRRVPVAVAAAVPLLCFAGTEDFRLKHLLEVDSGKVNFRVGMTADQAAHYYPRNDIVGAAKWLAAHVRPGDVVVAGIPSLDEYYPKIDYFFLDDGDDRYETYVCKDQKTERWTNHPVLYTADSLQPIVQSGMRVFASLYAVTERRLIRYAPSAGWSVTRVWTSEYGNADLVLIVRRAGAVQDR